MGFLSAFAIIPKIFGLDANGREDDDKYDRLNHRFTMVILLIFAVVVGERQMLFGDPIMCWVPAHFSDNWEEYTMQYCWVKNTYYLPMEDYIPREYEPEKREMLPYYQWVPFILMFQALLFHMPCTLWRTLNKRCGIDLDSFIAKAQIVAIIEEEDVRTKALNHMSFLMARFTRSQQMHDNYDCTISVKHVFGRTCLRCFGRNHGNYLVTLYMFIKVLYVINLVGQIFMLNWLLGTDYHIYGIDAIRMMAGGEEDWMKSPAFPRVTMCDFFVRRLGNVHRYSVQCVLPINLFNEKIYLFIYFWFIFIAILTIGSFVGWLKRAVPTVTRYRFLKKKLLRPLGMESDSDQVDERGEKEEIKRFIKEELREDGVFVLQLVAQNADRIVAEDIMTTMFDHFKEGKFHASHEEKKDENDNQEENTEKKSIVSSDDGEKPGTSRDSSINETTPLIDKPDAANNF